jgi:para-aminobenzoate synthetase component 1
MHALASSPAAAMTMTTPWLRRPGPPLSIAEALARLAQEPTLLVLQGGQTGWTYLAWGADQARLADLPRDFRAELASQSGGEYPDGASAWSGRFPGGWFIQLDYEYPSAQATLWAIDAVVVWSPSGSCELIARTTAGLDRLARGLEQHAPPPDHVRLASDLHTDWPAAGHRARIARIQEYIAAGDIYQANLTMSFSARMHPGQARDVAAFLALISSSPAPFSALLRAAGRSIISHSPECFLTVHDRRIACEPIKGTCRRTPGQEDAARARLLASAKDRAELAMIVDLMRNDIGRVATPGSVRVACPARILDLPYVHHLVARIEAELDATVGLEDLLTAIFPAGSITGAPKLRAMEIIRELEERPRGAYCGTFGWIASQGALELAVAIRTMEMTGDRVQFAAGGGIVSDSDPAQEWDELHAKASTMATVLGVRL